MEPAIRHIYYVTKQISTSRLYTAALTPTGTQLLWVHLYCSQDHQHDLHDHFGEITLLCFCIKPVYVCIMSLHVIKLLDIYVCAKTALDLKHICVAQNCCSVLLFVPKVKPVVSHFLEWGVFICYCAEGSEYERVKCVMFEWHFCGENEWRLIFGKIWYGIITKYSSNAWYKPWNRNTGVMTTSINFWSQLFMKLKQELQLVLHDRSPHNLCLYVPAHHL